MKSNNYLEFEFNRKITFEERVYINSLLERHKLININSKWYSSSKDREEEWSALYGFAVDIELEKPNLCSAFKRLDVFWSNIWSPVVEQWEEKGVLNDTKNK